MYTSHEPRMKKQISVTRNCDADPLAERPSRPSARDNLCQRSATLLGSNGIRSDGGTLLLERNPRMWGGWILSCSRRHRRGYWAPRGTRTADPNNTPEVWKFEEIGRRESRGCAIDGDQAEEFAL